MAFIQELTASLSIDARFGSVARIVSFGLDAVFPVENLLAILDKAQLTYKLVQLADWMGDG